MRHCEEGYFEICGKEIGPFLSPDGLGEKFDCYVSGKGVYADTDKFNFSGRLFIADLYFYENVIRKMFLYPVTEIQGAATQKDEEERFRISKEVLQSLFGKPHEEKENMVIYRYGWGNIFLKKTKNLFSGGAIHICYQEEKNNG